MLAIEYNGNLVLRKDYPAPRPAEGEALIAVRKAGICRTDLEITRGYMNFRGVLGHEFVGQVVEGPDEWKGKRVVGEVNCPCGQCPLCSMGLGKHCRSRTVLGIQGRGGVFAEFTALPAANLHEVPPGVGDDEAVFAEPLAAAMQIIRQVRFMPTDGAVVLGDGRLGLLAAMALRNVLRDILLVGKHANKLAIAKACGIKTILAKDFLPRRSARFVIDATGTAEGFSLALRTVMPTGTIVLKSTYASPGWLNLAPVVIDEITVVGSRCGPFADAINALKDRDVNVLPLISAHYDLSDGVTAMVAAADPSNIKVIIDVARQP
ncbi:MAG: alcohol dehydrogenase catalytic domain-containing protein [Planctomycetes bacterium]|nr:alcohol dehydrogenase catalytic domain-containing protein [Planctomycetota bacterium]